MKNYSAKLIFQATDHPKTHGRWLYEERIVCFGAKNAENAYSQACLIAKKFTYPGFRFIGVAAILVHYPILHENEVWYELHTSSNPKRLVPPKSSVLKEIG